MTLTHARSVGIEVDEKIAAQQAAASGAFAETWRPSMERLTGMPGGADAVSYILMGLGESRYPANPATDAMASFLLAAQTLEGRWRIQARRPPMEASDVTVTATSIRALQLYAPASARERVAVAIQSAVLWLRQARPGSTEDRVFQLLAFGWVNEPKELIDSAVDRLLAEQRPDGGWSQLPTIASDAYATGSALAALQHAGGLTASHPAVRRGVQFLVETQKPDGSWQVRTRSVPVQPYIESGFPHGNDQWISIAASNWAVQAIVLALRPNR